MKNQEKNLAKAIIEQYNFCGVMLNEDSNDMDYYIGQRVALIKIANTIFGADITDRMADFIKNLEEIANSEAQ